MFALSAEIGGLLAFWSLVEYVLHRYAMHQHVHYFERVYKDHVLFHHTCFKIFNNGSRPDCRCKNITLDLWLGLVFALPFCGILLLFSWTAPLFLFLIVTLHHLTWSKIHAEMHIPSGKWFRDAPLFRWLQRFHWIHHQYPNRNFNILFPFWDFILGTYRKPSLKDIEKMEATGI
jgi:sterol desaturase/sphingolipid hydroxylase (fatty acid hydroxylase superfamily)